jgi:hypothetical protein
MKGERGSSTMGEKKSVSKLNWVFVFTFVLLIGLALGVLATKYLNPNPLQQYITQRTCNFVTMGSFNVAVCDDGSAWSVTDFNQ